MSHVNGKHSTVEHHEGGRQRSLTTVTLSPEQFESLYMQPRTARMQGGLSKTFGNPTPLGITSFLLALTPLSMDLMGFQGATPASSVAMLGGFYACAGIGLYVAGIMEWIIGNTFPSVVFGSFGGFWLSYAIIIQPSFGLAASFASASDASNSITAAAAGAATRPYNSGLAMYFMVWGILCMIYSVAALRTNVPFFMIFFTLVFAFEFIAAGYFHIGQGRATLAATEFKAAGGFAFVCSLSGIWVDIHLVLASVGFPVNVPIIDLSTRLFKPKNEDLEKQA